MSSHIIQNLLATKDHPLPGLNAQKKMMLYPEKTYDPTPSYGKESAVLLNLYPEENGGTRIILIERATYHGSAHSGQISFPGGKKELSDIDLFSTAKREAHEEINLQIEELTFIRSLSPVYIPVSNFKVFPFLTFTEKMPAYLKADQKEVAKILHFNLHELFKSEVREAKINTFQNMTLKTAAFQHQQYTVWGATAMILAELQYLITGR